MHSIAVVLHLLGTVVWVGGMFFAHVALRPAAQELLEPAQRLPLLKRVLDRFFLWVWVAMLVTLASGYYMFFATYGGKPLVYVHIMSLLGLIMAAIFLLIWFLPYRKMGKALQAGDIANAAIQMGMIRLLILVNLALGLFEVVLGGAGIALSTMMVKG